MMSDKDKGEEGMEREEYVCLNCGKSSLHDKGIGFNSSKKCPRCCSLDLVQPPSTTYTDLPLSLETPINPVPEAETGGRRSAGLGYVGKDVDMIINSLVNKEASALDTQVGGKHYKGMAIQPVEYMQKNRLNFLESNIVRYASRHQYKNGAEDVRKIIHSAILLLEIEYGETYEDNQL